MSLVSRSASGNLLERLSRMELSGDLTLDGAISPATLGGMNTNDWNPTGLDTANVIRITPGGAINLTGIVAPSPARGKLLLLQNLDGANTITLKHQTTSAAANQFSCPNLADFALRKGGTIFVWYDKVLGFWMVFGG